VGLKKLAANFPALPMIVLPSSYQFLHTDFDSCFDKRTAPTYLFAREAASYARIANLDYSSPVLPFLHRDMSFELWASPFLEVLKKSTQSKHILLIERFDREATTQSAYKMDVSNAVKSAVPAQVKRFLKKRLHHIRRSKSGFTSTALSRLYSEHPEFRGLPVIAEDVSSNVGFTFEQFIKLIAQAAVVISNRLHAAILAAMLGKTTIVLSGHPYGKLEACYEFSLKDYPNVSLW
jgi:exopolysaccharide biosynthesis predicted pyruvyltransferase EpsI